MGYLIPKPPMPPINPSNITGSKTGWVYNYQESYQDSKIEYTMTSILKMLQHYERHIDEYAEQNPKHRDACNDAAYFLREAMESLDKVK